MNPNHPFRLDSADQLTEKLEKLKAYEQTLIGKELQLKKKEQQLDEKETQLKIFRKNILIAIREQITENNSYDKTVKILERYREILRYVADDIQDDIDGIMG